MQSRYSSRTRESWLVLASCAIASLGSNGSALARNIAVLPSTSCATEAVQDAFAVTARQLTSAQLSKARLELARVEDRGQPVTSLDATEHQYIVVIATGVSDPYEWFVIVHQEALLGKSQPKICVASAAPRKPTW